MQTIKLNNGIEMPQLGLGAKALKENGINREDVFITTKINADSLYVKDYQYGLHRFFNRRNGKSIDQVIQESFDNLETDYIDLFLIHWPWPLLLKMWKVLEKYYHEGRIRAIGVSNFLQPHIEWIMDNSDVVPAVNQFEISPLNTQKNLIKYCQDKGIAGWAQCHGRNAMTWKQKFEYDVRRSYFVHY